MEAGVPFILSSVEGSPGQSRATLTSPPFTVTFMGDCVIACAALINCLENL